jgi:hypothetical protein
LVAIYLILGMLYESTTHPLTIISTWPSAGLGALLTHMLVGTPLDVIGIIGIILLIGIVKKNGIMLVDFALAEGRETRAEQRGRHPPGMSDAVPPNPDDDAGRAALERAPFAQDGNRIGNSPAARLCDCRCSVHLAAAGACHHTDRLHQHGPTKRLDGTTAPAQWRLSSLRLSKAIGLIAGISRGDLRPNGDFVFVPAKPGCRPYKLVRLSAALSLPALRKLLSLAGGQFEFYGYPAVIRLPSGAAFYRPAGRRSAGRQRRR